jgi:hypothetical protein
MPTGDVPPYPTGVDVPPFPSGPVSGVPVVPPVPTEPPTANVEPPLSSVDGASLVPLLELHPAAATATAATNTNAKSFCMMTRTPPVQKNEPFQPQYELALENVDDDCTNSAQFAIERDSRCEERRDHMRRTHTA